MTRWPAREQGEAFFRHAKPWRGWRPARRNHRASSRGGSVLGGDQTEADGVAHQAGDVVDAEPLHQTRSVRFDSLHAGLEQLRDLLARLALGDQLQDLALARRQVLKRVAALVGGLTEINLDHMPGDRGAQEDLAASDRLYRE